MGRTILRPGEVRVGAEYADNQASEWRSVNAELVRKLSALVEGPQNRKIVPDVLALRDQLYGDFRMAEADLRSKQQELILAAENSDFIKAAVLSKDLVVLKARAQATQAAHHELDAVIRKSKIQITHHIEISPSGERTPYEEEDEDVMSDTGTGPALAKVIPLRKMAPGR